MKIHWFSPLPPLRTEIGNTTARILPELGSRADVVIWSPTPDWDPSLEQWARIKYLGENVPWAEFNYSDLCIYQIGNDGRFHHSILDVALRHPGVVVLHDLHLHDLIRFYFREIKRRDDDYLNCLRRCEGLAGLIAGQRYVRGEIDTKLLDQFQLFQLVTDHAKGVIVHNPANMGPLSEHIVCPAMSLPLPFAMKDAMRPERRRSFNGSRPVRMIVFGFLHGENRRLRPFLRAWAAMPERAAFRLNIVGEYGSEQDLTKELSDLGLLGFTKLNGFVAEPKLQKLLDDADLAINLRFPALGEASGSMLRIWNHSLPAIISRTGWYETLPEDLAFFVRPENETQDVQDALKGFLNQSPKYYAKGLNGRAYLAQNHSAETYITQVLQFCRDVRAETSPCNAIHTMESASAKLQSLSPGLTEYSVRRLAEIVQSIS